MLFCFNSQCHNPPPHTKPCYSVNSLLSFTLSYTGFIQERQFNFFPHFVFWYVKLSFLGFWSFALQSFRTRQYWVLAPGGPLCFLFSILSCFQITPPTPPMTSFSLFPVHTQSLLLCVLSPLSIISFPEPFNSPLTLFIPLSAPLYSDPLCPTFPSPLS